ncbi:unnamed protein product [Periconia digitata]|uniref:Cutinase n=1 Tax=Periconia digitata TaxID=1303443 RepID=A0A9W4U520_9PLEO|nr:unnamed protein product [Periconia digitata]
MICLIEKQNLELTGSSMGLMKNNEEKVFIRPTSLCKRSCFYSRTTVVAILQVSHLQTFTMQFTLLLPLLATAAYSAPVENLQERAACSSYTIINTRGTGEIQGESSGFRTINANVQKQVSGGKIVNTVYLAGADQNSAAATSFIINQVSSTLQTNPSECFILEGYSQGAAGTVNALPKLTGASFDAVKGVFLIGDPMHKRGLACNVDNNGGSTTKNVQGLSALLGSGIPDNWVSKTLDVCIFGDGVCDTTHGFGINAAHLRYPMDTATQRLGTDFITKQLAA